MWAMLQKSIKRYPVVTFFVLTYIFSWGLIIPAYTIFRSSLFLAWVGLFGPAIAGLVMTVYCDGKEGIKRLIKGMTKWRSNWGAYLFVFGVPFVLVAGTIFLHDGLGPLITWVGTLKKNTAVIHRYGSIDVDPSSWRGNWLAWICVTQIARKIRFKYCFNADRLSMGSMAYSTSPRSNKCTKQRPIPNFRCNFHCKYDLFLIFVYLALELFRKKPVIDMPFSLFV